MTFLVFVCRCLPLLVIVLLWTVPSQVYSQQDDKTAVAEQLADDLVTAESIDKLLARVESNDLEPASEGE